MMERLKVYYGWAKIGNVRKKRALSVMFENEIQGCRSDRGQRVLRTIQDTVIERYQTEGEEKEGWKQNRIFTEYSLYICVGSIYEQCIPYEGNEHLLGTTDNLEK